MNETIYFGSTHIAKLAFVDKSINTSVNLKVKWDGKSLQTDPRLKEKIKEIYTSFNVDDIIVRDVYFEDDSGERRKRGDIKVIQYIIDDISEKIQQELK